MGSGKETAIREFVEHTAQQSPYQNVQLDRFEGLAKMTETRNRDKKNKEAWHGLARKSSNQRKKQHKKENERTTTFKNKNIDGQRIARLQSGPLLLAIWRQPSHVPF